MPQSGYTLPPLTSQGPPERPSSARDRAPVAPPRGGDRSGTRYPQPVTHSPTRKPARARNAAPGEQVRLQNPKGK